MKNVLFLAIALVAFTFTGNAQNDNEKKAATRNLQLQELLTNRLQDDCGIASVDNYRKSICEAAMFSIKNSEKLESLKGKENVSLLDITTLGITIKEEVEKTKEAMEMAEKAANELKEFTTNSTKGNPLKAAKAAKQAKAGAGIMEHSSTAIKIITEETAAKLKTIEEMTAAAKE
ncbi:MAG: hypothetical protein IJZ22_03580 [Bacteroidaceae bacterium]|nr:hypothetical protein [Bacteroidaceae bacterium]